MQTPPGPYNSVILNEIHMMFPSLLYDRTRFHTIHDVFGYIDSQMSARYDIFSSWRNQYQQHFAAAPPLPPTQQHHQRARPARIIRRQPVPTQRAPVTTDILTQTMILDPVTQLLIRTMLTGSAAPNTATASTGNATNTFWDQVWVAPTVQELAAASTVYAAPTRLDTPCAICQDIIAEGDSVRKLNHCNHFFHRACVDTWFQRGIQCPVCRHDIRGNTVTQS